MVCASMLPDTLVSFTKASNMVRECLDTDKNGEVVSIETDLLSLCVIDTVYLFLC